MTEERKQELRQLLEEARKSLVIRYEYGGPVSYIPPDVYRRVLTRALDLLWGRFLIVCIFDSICS